MAAQHVERGQAGKAAADDGDVGRRLGESGPARQGRKADAPGDRGQHAAAGHVAAAGLGRRRFRRRQVHCPRPIERPPDKAAPHALPPFWTDRRSIIGNNRAGLGMGGFRALPPAPAPC